jgi:hypothetical protein
MQAVAGIFSSQADAEGALEHLRESGIPSDKITLLSPGKNLQDLQAVPADATEQPGMGKAIGALVGAAAGLSGGGLAMAALVPGVGPITAAGLLGAAVLGAAGATIGAVTGESLENSTTEGLPEDEIFVYEDALRKGKSVVLALAEDARAAARLRERLKADRAESVDAARQQWWIGLRSAEQENYSRSGRNFRDDEKFYRLGFEAALHAKTRCMEFDQVSAEMESNLEDLQRQYPDADAAEPFTRGYQRGREYYQHMCEETKAA